MTIKKLRFAKNLTMGMKKAEAAKAAGYCEKSAHVTASRLMKDPEVKEILSNAFDKAGFTVEKKAQRLAEALDANNGINADHATRLKAVEIGLKYRFPSLQDKDGDTINLAVFIGQAMESASAREAYING